MDDGGATNGRRTSCGGAGSPSSFTSILGAGSARASPLCSGAFGVASAADRRAPLSSTTSSSPSSESRCRAARRSYAESTERQSARGDRRESSADFGPSSFPFAAASLLPLSFSPPRRYPRHHSTRAAPMASNKQTRVIQFVLPRRGECSSWANAPASRGGGMCVDDCQSIADTHECHDSGHNFDGALRLCTYTDVCRYAGAFETCCSAKKHRT
jgi:hypothetical protein